jgi:cyclic pyranopterin phosphate synthase
MAKLTHVDDKGRPRMVDITEKDDTRREAITKGVVRMKAETLSLLQKGLLPKGDVLSVAQIAGIMAAKLLLSEIKVEFEIDEPHHSVLITSTVKNSGKTGVEMEAMTATAIAALTIYDMCKAVDKGIKIDNIRLVKKSGGKAEP